MKTNGIFFCLIAIAAAIAVVFVVPYLRDTGHVWLCIPLFAFLFVLAFYGRCNPLPRHRTKKSLRAE
jgi:hypothetical protein